MLKKHGAFFRTMRIIADAAFIGVVWVGAYFLRFMSGFFNSGVFTQIEQLPNLDHHLILAMPVMFLCCLGCSWTGLYRPKRMKNLIVQLGEILRATAFNALLVAGFLFCLQSVSYSRGMFMFFVLMMFGGLVLSHLLTISIMRYLRNREYNLRYYAVIGAGKVGQKLIRDIESVTWFGLKCRFIVDDNPDRIGTTIHGIPVYGPIEKLKELAEADSLDEVYLTLGNGKAQKAYPILQSLQASGVTVRVVPDWGPLLWMSGPTITNIGSQVLFSAADSPLTGANVVLKEVFDRVMGITLLAICAIPMAIIALIIKLTSGGPVFYKQTRVGMDQKEFQIIKFRTMKVGAEKQTGPKWASPNDRRRTAFGSWLRNTSLDELPQLANVITGDMSLIGPRPERPYFVKQFAEEYKKYMFRHKVKAGITGWAQVHGFRGSTSLKKRLQYDLYYVRNWSFGLDLKTLLLTPLHMLARKNAY